MRNEKHADNAAGIEIKRPRPPMKVLLRIALGALVAVALALAAAAAAFLSGIDTDGEFLRGRLESSLTRAFGVPTRIEGPIRLRTGRVATVAADALVLADPSSPAGSTFARGVRPSARIDLSELLLRRTVVFEEVTGERLQLELRRHAGGEGNWAQLFVRPPGPEATVSFAGIEKLRIGSVEGTYLREGEAAVPFAIHSLDASLPSDGPVAAAGNLQLAGHAIAFDLRAAPLQGLNSSETAFPLQGSLSWNGVRTTIDGRISNRGERIETILNASAEDAQAPLAALGFTVQDPGPLAVTGRLSLTAGEATAEEMVIAIGSSVLSGRGSIAWGGPQWRLVLDLRSERIDPTPFLAAGSMRDGATAPQRIVEALHGLATSTDAAVKLAVDEIDVPSVAVQTLRLELRSGDRRVEALGDAVVSGTRVNATLDYDARQEQRRLELRVDGGAVSTASLPSGLKPRALAASATAIRGQLRGEGADPAALASSLQGGLDARGVRWSFAPDSRPPISGRLDVLRVSAPGTRTLSAEATGSIDGASCSVTVFGGALESLLSGRQWPVTMSAKCPGERLRAEGRIAFVERYPAADLAFDLSTDRSGPAARLIGVPPDLLRPIAASGKLALDGREAKAKLSALRAGRTTAKSGEFVYPLGRNGVPRLRLSLATLDLNEFGRSGEPVPGDPLERRVLRKDLRLPDLDFAIGAERVEFGELRLRNLEIAGVISRRTMPPAPFHFEWETMLLHGQLGLDFAGPSPRLQIEAKSENADLAALLARLGVKDVKLTAARLSVNGHAHGERLADLLATATVDAAVEQARFDLPKLQLPDAAVRGTLSGTLAAAAGRTTSFAASGEIAGRPIHLDASAPAVGAWVHRAAAVPMSLRAAIGDLHLEAEGDFARDGSGKGRIQLAGARLDELGDLLGVALPQGGYEASATVVLAPEKIRVPDLSLRFGRSQVAGSVQIDRHDGGRRRHVASLRAAALHLEDIGAAHWLRPAQTIETEPMTARLSALGPKIDEGLDLLRATDIDVSLDIDALHSGGEPFASGGVRASAAAGKLQVWLQSARAGDARADADIEIDASAAQPRYALRADLQDLDYGPLVRAYDPESQLGGRLNFLADLATSGPTTELVSQLGGTLDVAVFPQGLESRALDLWGTALMSGILRQVDPNARSAVECGVVGFDIVSGVATSNGFFIDTTRMRISGDVSIDIATREVSGRINARSDAPHLFTFAPTMIVSGPVERPTLVAAPENVVLVPLRFAAPLARFARDWLSGGRLAEARTGCQEAFEQVRQGHVGTAPSPR